MLKTYTQNLYSEHRSFEVIVATKKSSYKKKIRRCFYLYKFYFINNN